MSVLGKTGLERLWTHITTEVNDVKSYTNEQIASLTSGDVTVAHATTADTAMDADTVDGKHASDFALATDLDALEGLVGDTSVSDQIGTAIDQIPQSDWAQNDAAASDYIKNRPFYIEQGEENIIFEETTVSTSESSVRDGYYTALLNEYPIGLEVSKTYYVLFNGIEYECVCYEDKANGFLSLGNEWIPLYDPEPEDSGEPFYIHDAMDAEPYVTMYTSISGDITIKITEKSVTIHKIPADFLYTPDWNQNDETAADYIQNRPFYSKTSIGDVFLENQTITVDEYLNYFFDEAEQLGYEDGKNYVVIFDGITYSCEAFSEDEGTNVYVGNLCLVSDMLEDTGEPFCLYSYTPEIGIGVYTMEEGEHTIEVFEGASEIVKIDKIYLPALTGEAVAGKTYSDMSDPETDQIVDLIAGDGAEIFNDYVYNVAIGLYSHSEGSNTQALGDYSHAEGSDTYTSGYAGHAEGYDTFAVGNYSHSEGYKTRASGMFSHAEGHETIAASDCQHVQGKYNIEDANNKYIHIVGNGGRNNNSEHSNAHTLDWDGNAWFAGDIKIGGTGQDDAAAKTIATTEDIDIAVGTVSTLVGDTPVATQIADAIAAIPTTELTWDEIQDKPGGYYKKTREVFSAEGTVFENVEATFNDGYAYFTDSDTTSYPVFVTYKTYIVVWDGVEYERDLYEGSASWCIGDRSAGDPFCLMDGYSLSIEAYKENGEYEEGTTTHTISIYGVVETAVPFDTELIPDHIHNWDDIQDKPFSHEETIVMEQQELDFEYNEYQGYYEYNGDVVIPLFEKDKTYIVYLDGVAYMCVGTQYTAEMYLGNSYFIESSTPNNGMPFVIHYYPEPDTVALLVCTTPGPHTVGFSEIANVKPLDEFYLPNHTHDWDEVENKPFGYYEINKYGFTDENGNNSDNIGTLTFEDGVCASTGLYFYFHDGEEWSVFWDGIEYNCVAYDGGAGTWLGGASDGYPFQIASADLTNTFWAYDENGEAETGTTTHSVALFIVNKTPVKVDKEWLPTLTATDDGNGNVTITLG